MKVLGLTLDRGPFTERRSVIGDVEQSASGNVVLRVGHEWVNGAGATTSWTQTEHVVLTPDEASELQRELAAKMPPSEGVFNVEAHADGWTIYKNGWGCGHTFAHREFAEAACATLNVMAERDAQWDAQWAARDKQA